MANVPLQNHQQSVASSDASGAYYVTNNSIQQQQQQYQYGVGNYYPTAASSQQTFWSGSSTGYNQGQTGTGYYNGSTTYQVATPYQRTHWNNAQNTSCNGMYPKQTTVAIGNRSKRSYSGAMVPMHDITNQQQGVTHQKRRKIVSNHCVRKPATVPQSTCGPAKTVRIESIFRHVELLAQSYWQTVATATPTLKPATVEAFENITGSA